MQPSPSSDHSPSTHPPKVFPQDFPPPPKCFLHLLDDSSPESPTAHHVDILSSSGNKHNFPVSDKIDSHSKGRHISNVAESYLPPAVDKPTNSNPDSPKALSLEKNSTPFTFNQDGKSSTSVHEGAVPFLSSQTQRKSKSEDFQVKEKAELLGRLNSSLSKLKKEMTDLRTMDVSLLFQLISLHEAIQDFKMTVGDRFSEAGSEYSLGSASYMGSMSSLSEEDSDWMEGFQSHSSMKGLDDSQVFVDNQCASTLLDQITALVKKTDTDF